MKIASFVAAALASVVTAQDACKLYNYYSSNGYEILNNLWGKDTATSGSQCTYVDGVTDAGTKWHSNWTWAGAPNNVKSYVYAGRLFTKKPVSQFTNLQTEANWAYDTTNIRCNVAYDLFTAQDVNHTTSSGDYELMIWQVHPLTSHIFNYTNRAIGWLDTTSTPSAARKAWSRSPAAPGSFSTASTAR